MIQKLKPIKYQLEGIELMVKFGSCIQADDMGLGKTMQTILTIEKLQSYPCLIICPASLKLNWEIEISKWSDKRGMILNDSIKNTFPLLYKAGISDYFIVNYESLSKYFVHSKPNRKDFRLDDIVFNEYRNFFKSVIVDESHRVKDVKSLQSKLTAGICMGADKNVFLLSGTPTLNTVLDLAPQLYIAKKIHHFGGYTKFISDYKDADIDKLSLLHKKLIKTSMIRREKKDVAGLPKKTRQVIYVDIDNRTEYNAAVKDLASYLKEYRGKTDSEVRRSMRGEVMVRVGILKQLSGIGKVNAVKEHIQNLHEQGEKVILFGENIDVLESFKAMKNTVSIVGGMSSESKQYSINKFQTDKITNLIVCSLKAAGVGVTLTAGRIVSFIQQGWHPAIMNQAEDRGHRLGQEKEVHCLYYIGKNTIDEHIYNIIEKKRKTSNAITGTTEDIEWAVIDEVIDLILNENDN